MEYKDYYKTLGVGRTATADEIKKAYRQLARRYHPDINKEPGAEARFKDINQANDVLGDAEKRKAYDELGQDFASGQQFRPPPGWEQSHPAGQRGSQGREADFSEFFEDLFGRGGFRQSRRPGAGAPNGQSMRVRGEDAHARVIVSLQDSMAGATRQMTLRVPEFHGDHIEVRDKVLEVRIPQGHHRRQDHPAEGAGRSGHRRRRGGRSLS